MMKSDMERHIGETMAVVHPERLVELEAAWLFVQPLATVPLLGFSA
jgi:hypothetical protein